MTKNVYHKTKTFLVSPAKPMVTEKEVNGRDPHGCNVDKLPLLRHWKERGNWAEIFKEQKINILYSLCSCNLDPYSAKH